MHGTCVTHDVCLSPIPYVYLIVYYCVQETFTELRVIQL